MNSYDIRVAIVKVMVVVYETMDPVAFDIVLKRVARSRYPVRITNRDAFVQEVYKAIGATK
jgi:hypothetical protein